MSLRVISVIQKPERLIETSRCALHQYNHSCSGVQSGNFGCEVFSKMFSKKLGEGSRVEKRHFHSSAQAILTSSPDNSPVAHTGDPLSLGHFNNAVSGLEFGWP